GAGDAIDVRRGAPRPQGVGLVAPHRAEATRVEVVEEGQRVEVAEAVAIAQLGAEAQREAVAQRHEQLAVVHDLVVLEITAGDGYLERDALAVTPGGELAAVEGGGDPGGGEG